jgi:hypothetical protein
MRKTLPMRMIWNAGAAVTVTALLTLVAAAGAGPVRPARAASAPELSAGKIADMSHRHYTGLAEHFEAANTSQDGKLTLAQASQAGWSRVVRHFAEIDAAHVGYVTRDQIHAYNLAHHHGHKAAATADAS